MVQVNPVPVSELLIPFPEFEPADLARQLPEAAQRNDSVLKARAFVGPLALLKEDSADIEAFVVDCQREHEAGLNGHFAVMGEDGNVAGAALVAPGRELIQTYAPLPTALFPKRLVRNFPYANPFVRVWADANQNLLESSYEQLITGTAGRFNHIVNPDTPGGGHLGRFWTIEPFWAPQDVHSAVMRAGMRKIASRWFDDGEGKLRMTPVSTLYAALDNNWRGRRAALRELTDGKDSITDSLFRELS
jgi:hypothetical protein